MRWQSNISVRPASGFIEPCIPSPAERAPAGSDWVYELKHDGYRLMVRKDGQTVRLYSRRGSDFTKRFPQIVQAAHRIKAQSFLLDGEAIVYDSAGIPNFALLHSREFDKEASMIAFDLLELGGDNVRMVALYERKKRLAKLLSKLNHGIEYSEHLEGEGHDIFRAACEIGCEGIVAKRVDLPYESGRSKRWLKVKNPDSPAMKRVEDSTF